MRQREQPPLGRVRYIVAGLSRGGYVVYDRRMGRIADGRYLSFTDAQWAAEQRNRAEWKAIVNG